MRIQRLGVLDFLEIPPLPIFEQPGFVNMRGQFNIIFAAEHGPEINSHEGVAFAGLNAIHTDDFSAKPCDGAAEAVAISVGADDSSETGRVIAVGATELPRYQSLPALCGTLTHLFFGRATAQAGAGRQCEGNAEHCAQRHPAFNVAPLGTCVATLIAC